MKVATIVEGDGDAIALPVLLRRMAEWLSPNISVDVLPPIRVRRNRFLNIEDDSEFRRMLLLAGAKCGDNGKVIILMDADDDCPAELGPSIYSKARQVIPHRNVSVILANREYEAWFIAAAQSLHGHRGFSQAEQQNVEAESIRGAKEWLGRHMSSGKYREITDQPAFSAQIDLLQARQNSRSFRKLCDEWVRSEFCEMS